jgi:hypothetical protein
MDVFAWGIALTNGSPASAKQGSLRLTFKLLLQYLLVTEHDPAIDGHQPELERIEGPAQGVQDGSRKPYNGLGKPSDLKEIELLDATKYRVHRTVLVDHSPSPSSIRFHNSQGCILAAPRMPKRKLDRMEEGRYEPTWILD